jgi:hypothetical protein
VPHALLLAIRLPAACRWAACRWLRALAKREEARMLTDEHHAVNTMIDQGAAFDQIEDYINTLALPGEQLSALWLLAWAEATDPATRRQVVEATLAAAQ